MMNLLLLLYTATGLFSSILPTPRTAVAGDSLYFHESETWFTYVTDLSLPEENYRLEITPGGVEIASSEIRGRYYALVSLSQLAGVPVDSLETVEWISQCGVIEDGPRFAWRGLMVDVSRHFRSVDFLYRHIDAMARYKMNKLHLHLTDGGGWRLECEAYPLLNEVAAWRPDGMSYMKWWRTTDRNYGGGYGGYYTKQQMKDLIAYAAERGIDIIPEIEIPGHNDETTAVYPFLSCDGKKHGEVCPGKESTFEFFETVLKEVMEVFPSKYIHIGGDEAAKERWKKCPDCQRRMKEEGLKGVDELQSYTITRIGKFVSECGREIVGWDEILQGGLAPGAVVMSWRGVSGGKAAAAAGHDVVMTPGEWCYIDTAQDFPEGEPLAFGNYLPSWKIYQYDPRAGVKGAEHVIGVQANLWSECVGTDELAEYMYWPRGMAMAEVGWSVAKKNWPEFRERAIAESDWMRSKGYNVFDLRTEKGERKEALAPQDHMAKGLPVQLQGKCRWSSSYPAGGKNALTDGLCGGWTYKDGRWQGYLCDFVGVIDLGKPTDIHSISMMSMQNEFHGLFLPEYIRYSVSQDGVEWTPLKRVDSDVSPRKWGCFFRNYRWEGEASARYLKIEAPRCEKGGFIFLDEIIVR